MKNLSIDCLSQFRVQQNLQWCRLICTPCKSCRWKTQQSIVSNVKIGGPFAKCCNGIFAQCVRSVAQTQAWMTAFETIHQSDNRACAATIRQFLVQVVYICILSAEHEKMRTNNTRSTAKFWEWHARVENIINKADGNRRDVSRNEFRWETAAGKCKCWGKRDNSMAFLA